VTININANNPNVVANFFIIVRLFYIFCFASFLWCVPNN
jgi:hypothetical protein